MKIYLAQNCDPNFYVLLKDYDSALLFFVFGVFMVKGTIHTPFILSLSKKRNSYTFLVEKFIRFLILISLAKEDKKKKLRMNDTSGKIKTKQQRGLFKTQVASLGAAKILTNEDNRGREGAKNDDENKGREKIYNANCI